jgi:SNF2 family DNA or RNA helicase
MLTGTPAAHSPVDAFGLARMIVPDRVPRFMGAFKDKVMQRISQFKWIPRPEAVDIVHNVLQPSIRFTKKECLDLPEITYLTRRIPLTKQQDIYRNKIKKDNLVLAANECISAVNAATLLNKLLQLSCGAVYSDTGEIISFDGGNRLQELLAAVKESSNKVLVFVPFKHAIEIISEALTKEKITNDIISGEVTPKKRTGIFSAFQDKPDPKVLIIQPQAAAHGVTLTAADTIIWYGPPLSLETYLQANARAHRKGQKNPLTIINLEGSYEESKVYSALVKKQNIHEQIVELFKEKVDKVNN